MFASNLIFFELLLTLEIIQKATNYLAILEMKDYVEEFIKVYIFPLVTCLETALPVFIS